MQLQRTDGDVLGKMQARAVKEAQPNGACADVRHQRGGEGAPLFFRILADCLEHLGINQVFFLIIF